MPERTRRFPWSPFVGAVVVIVGGAFFFGLPDALAKEGTPKVIRVPDIPEIIRQADWVHEQRAQARARVGGGVPAGGSAAGPVAVEGASPEPAPAAAARPAIAAAPAASKPADVVRAPDPEPVAPPAPESQGAPAAADDVTASSAEGADAAGLAATESAPPAPEPPTKALAPAEPEAPASAAAGTKASSSSTPGDLEPPYELEITATARQVWIWISVDDGPQQAVSLERGESARFRAEDRYVLTVDDAGGVEASLNGRELPSLGRKAQARRDLVIPSPELAPVG